LLTNIGSFSQEWFLFGTPENSLPYGMLRNQGLVNLFFPLPDYSPVILVYLLQFVLRDTSSIPLNGMAPGTDRSCMGAGGFQPVYSVQHARYATCHQKFNPGRNNISTFKELK
jgi:hypothetical protein